MSRSFELPEADWATIGAVGEPGQRTFYLQARQEDQLLTLKLEKQQVAALAHFLGEVLADLPATAGERPPTGLVEPVLAEWPVGGLQLTYDTVADRIVIMAEEIGLEDDEDEDEGGDPDTPSDTEHGVARIGITRTTAAAIVDVGAELVVAGRPICGLCGRPMAPEGHSCPKTNGHKPN